MVCGDPLDGLQLPSCGGQRPDGKDLSLDVSHLWAFGLCIAAVSGYAAVLPPVAEGGVLCSLHFYGGISDRMAAADCDGGVPLGLRGQAFFHYGVHPSGLCPSMGDVRVVF